jgi:hypothetical protein
VVVYSCTKHMDGQGRVLGGAVLGSKKWVEEVLQPFTRNTGPALSPFNAWVILKGLETLSLRVAAMCRGAEVVAGFLAGRPEVSRTLYPFAPSHPQQALARKLMSGGGTVVTFELRGGKDAAFRFCNALRIIDVSNNLGDSKSLVTHPATTTHMRIGAEERARLGITDGTIRLSVGLEDVAQGPSLRREIDVHLAPVVGVADPFHEPPPFHSIEGRDGRRLHHPDPLAQFALGQPVLLPESTEEEPLAHADAVVRDPVLKRAHVSAICFADQMPQKRLSGIVGRDGRTALQFLRLHTHERLSAPDPHRTGAIGSIYGCIARTPFLQKLKR